MSKIAETCINQLFHGARTFRQFKPQAVTTDTLKEVFNIASAGPTAFNNCPARFIFVKSPEAKKKLLGCVAPGNIPSIESAPVTVIIGADYDFIQKLGKLSPGYDAVSEYKKNPEWIDPAADYNASLQAGYFIIAARAMGLDCGPMTGFDPAAVDKEFFDGSKIKSQVLINLGYGVEGSPYPRSPRLEFDEACKML
jgi:nitroreductase